MKTLIAVGDVELNDFITTQFCEEIISGKHSFVGKNESGITVKISQKKVFAALASTTIYTVCINNGFENEMPASLYWEIIDLLNLQFS